MNKQPVLFISHGGGPWPWVPEMRETFAKTELELKRLPERLPAPPKAIVVVSGHWEEAEFTVSAAAQPPMVFDYSGFPAHTYQISYPAPGSPEVAKRVRNLIESSGMKAATDTTRGFDHGTFVPLAFMYPEAQIPVVSLSLKSSYDPEEHLRLGEALQPLREEGMLLIGSGLSYHNMRGFRTASGGHVSEQFETWLTQAIANPSSRKQNLVNWEQAPAARLAHPREDHLLPMMVVAGAAGKSPGERLFVDHAMGVVMATYWFRS